MVRISAHNQFYDGWLACCLGLPMGALPAGLSVIQKESWLEGWQMAFETNLLQSFRDVLQAEARLGHVIIEHL